MLELWRELGRPARGRLFLALALSAAAGASGVILLGLSGWFLTAAALAGLAGGGYVFNHLYPSAGVRAAAFSRVLTRYGEQLVGHDATLGISATLRPRAFAASAQHRRGFTPLPAADLAAIIDDVDAAEAGFLKVASPLCAIAAGLAVALGFAFAADLISGLVALLASALVAIVLPLRLVRASEAATEASARLAGKGRQSAAGLVENAVELETFNALHLAADHVADDLANWAGSERRLDRSFQRQSTLTGAIGALSALFIIWRGITGAGDLALSVAAALAVIAALDAAASMVSVLNAASRSEQAARRLFGRIRQPDADWNPPEAEAREIDTVLPVRAAGLRFSPAIDAPVLGPVDLEIHAGQIVQLIGPSGSRKSTLAETLMRLHPTAGGALSYAGIPAEELRIATVLERVAYAPQLPTFLSGPLIEQLKLARPLATDTDIAAALSVACADDFVARSPGGLTSAFSEGNLPFSGGELRRLGIARALLADPEILILDEPFAGLDAAVARQLAINLKNWVSEQPRAMLLLGHEMIDLFGQKVVTLELGSPSPVTSH